MLVLLFGLGTLALYQVMALEDQLDTVTRTIDKMDGKVKRVQYEKAKFYALARDVLRLAPKDPNAEQVVVDFKIRQLQAAQPALFALNAPSAPGATNAATNSVPTYPSETTNAAPLNSHSPAAK
jgi:TolA-binding protein